MFIADRTLQNLDYTILPHFAKFRKRRLISGKHNLQCRIDRPLVNIRAHSSVTCGTIRKFARQLSIRYRTINISFYDRLTIERLRTLFLIRKLLRWLLLISRGHCVVQIFFLLIKQCRSSICKSIVEMILCHCCSVH